MSSDMDLQSFRDHIDSSDDKLLDALSERMRVIDQIRDYKQEQGGSVHDPKRVQEVLETRASSRGNLPANFVREIFGLIIKHSEERQKNRQSGKTPNDTSASTSLPISQI